MKTLRWLVLVMAGMGVALAVSALTALAADPVNNGPATAFYIDNQPHTIEASTAQWYRFEYGGGNSLITATLVGGANSGVRFNVFTPDQALDLTNEKPIGRGTVLTINCNSGLPAPGGGCQGNDLIWTGKFPASGIYYVQVINDNAALTTFTLTIAGDNVTQCTAPGTSQANQPGVMLCAPSQTATATGTQTRVGGATTAPRQTTTPVTAAKSPTTTTTQNPNQNTGGQPCAPATANAQCVSQPNTFYTDPFHALAMTNQPQTIPANASIWYRFEYSGDNSDIVLRMLDGAQNGLTFLVYTPDQAATWYTETAIGKGTATSCTLSGDTSNCGQNVNDLLWSGKFPTRGTYFVRVRNMTNNPVSFVLIVTGSGVGLCGANGQIGNGNPSQFTAQTDTQNQFLLPCPTTGQP